MDMAKIARVTALSTLLIALLALGALAQQSGTTFADSFHGTTLDSTHWKAGKLNAAGNITPTTQGLQMTFTVRNVAHFFAETVWLTCRIPSDFSAQVDFRLADWEANSGIHLGIGVRPNALPLGSTTLHGNGTQRSLRAAIVERLNLQPNQSNEQPAGGDFYAGEFNGTQTFLTPTERPSGTLRIARVQGQFTAYYWDGKIWVPLGFWSPTSGVEDVWLALEMWGSDSSPNTQIFFENFSITASALGCS